MKRLARRRPLLARQKFRHFGATNGTGAFGRPAAILHRHLLGILHFATGLALHAVGVYVHAELLLATFTVCAHSIKRYATTLEANSFDLDKCSASRRGGTSRLPGEMWFRRDLSLEVKLVLIMG